MSIARRLRQHDETVLNSAGASIDCAKGHVLVVWSLDTLSRSLRDVLTIMERLGDAGAGLRSLTE